MQILDVLVEWISKVNSVINSVVWGPPMLILLVGVGIYFTIRTGFFPGAEVWIFAQENHIFCFQR